MKTLHPAPNRFPRITIGLACLGWLIVTQSIAVAQVERYELGKRLRRYEETWSQANAERQFASTPAVQQAVSSFFGLQLKTAAAKLDDAWIVVRGQAATDFERALIPYRIDLNRAIYEPDGPGVNLPDALPQNPLLVKLEPFYRSELQIPLDTKVTFALKDKTGQLVEQVSSNWEQATTGMVWPLVNVTDGDYQIHCQVAVESGTYSLLPVGVSQLRRLDQRLARLEATFRNKDIELNETVRATLSEHHQLLQQGREPFAAETDYPFDQILQLAESILPSTEPAEPTNGQAIASGSPNAPEKLSAAATQHDVWLVLSENRRRVPIRIRAPQPTPKNGAPEHSPPKRPVLFLFHGAGGSENMFFETYGAGAAVQMGLDRGWIVVAPRQGLMGLGLNCQQMLNALEPLFDLDRERVYLLGHSMGAAQVIQQVNLNPDLPRAAAAIGGGRPIRDPQQIAGVPWFVSAGELDFGRGGAKSFHQSLTKVEAANAVYVEYPGIEHLVIVQAALPKAFEFFDQLK